MSHCECYDTAVVQCQSQIKEEHFWNQDKKLCRTSIAEMHTLAHLEKLIKILHFGLII